MFKAQGGGLCKWGRLTDSSNLVAGFWSTEWGQKRSERWALSALKWPLLCFLHCADPVGAKGPALV